MFQLSPVKEALAPVARIDFGLRGDDPRSGEGRTKRLSSAVRRERLLESAAAVFACRGLRGTATAVLAARAGVSEPVLYAHFPTKEQLFRETVQRNVERRLETLDRQLAMISADSLVSCVGSMAERTASVCVTDGANAVLTNWALLEAPEYATDLHRRELGCVRSIWMRRMTDRFPDGGQVAIIEMHLLPYAIQACLAYGFWLAALRHNALSAAPVTHEFAVGIARLASTLIGSNA